MSKNPYLLVIGGVFALFIAMSIGRFAYTPILPFMQQDTGFSTRFAGYLASSNYAGYLVGAVIASIVPLKRHRAILLRITIIISILLTLVMGLTYSYTVWMVWRFLSGITSALVFVLASSLILDQLAKQRKLSLVGIMYGGVGLGIFVSGLLVPLLIKNYQYEGAWIGLAGLAAVLSIIVFLTVKEDHSEPAISPVAESSKQSKTPKWLPWLLVAYGLEGLGYIVTGTFIVAIAEHTPAFSGNATSVWVLVGLAAIPSCVIWAYFGSKHGYMLSLMILLIIQSIGIALPALSESSTSFYISAILFGATFMGVTTLATAFARNKNPHGSARVIAIMTTIYALGQMIGPSIAGVLATETESYSLALVGAASVVFVGALFLMPLIKHERLENKNDVN
ncbi:YbfB/YjiJ family MFS transporter [Paenisporosarcina quisquiliarum]|uniref:YbfB/YjiJ family MFS transporter n=1 Tax=Paenisporosarcina quisquiliarum TaxID=365346 RepID=A0A9X3LFB1_9BACL|nr:YbfB/YjiJ family MFS transporter [Paenisporosarcina quisquiliarum]MCZ8536863.1 YbfB/YjiJ family MFS transporter [Paenisporosarcina quisquiliarum]